MIHAIKTSRQMGLFQELIVDNFAGGGGASTGIETAGYTVDIAINHDDEALAMHEANHPLTRHYCESVWDIDPVEVTDGKPVALAWFSPDCKHFSKAKGGAPKSKAVRGLAWVAIRWAATVKPRIIILENVEEFVTWGPLLPDGTACKKRKGNTFNSFLNAFKRLGYQVEFKELIAYKFGAPTTRKRFFLVARRDGLPIVWPEETHGMPTSEAVKKGRLKPWVTAAEIIDWSLPCPSIFERKKPLAENTLKRIARGIQKYVIDAKKPFIVTCNHSGDGFRGQGIEEPFKTLTASRDAHGLVVPTLIQTGYGEHPGQKPRVPGLDKPLGTCMAQGIKHAVIGASLIQMVFGEAKGSPPRAITLEKPLGTVCATSVKHALAVATLIKNYGGNYKGAGVDIQGPLHTVTTQDHHSLVAASLIRHFGTSTGSPVDEPARTVMTEGGGKTGLIQAFLMKYFTRGSGQSILEPAHTITTKDRLALVVIDSVEYVIVDIGMRMLEPHELFAAQGFPSNYIIDECNGRKLSKTAQVRMVGNSVSPCVARALVEANLGQVAKRKRA